MTVTRTTLLVLPASLASSATVTGPAAPTRKYALVTVFGLVQLAKPLSLMISCALASALVMKALPARATVAGVPVTDGRLLAAWIAVAPALPPPPLPQAASNNGAVERTA
ncbi:hypothetical protein D3C81_1189290 [compost metagenome]